MRARPTFSPVNRFVPIRGIVRAEINRIIATNALGEALAAVPSSTSRMQTSAGCGQRQFQLGVKLYF